MDAAFATPKISNIRQQKRPPMTMRQRQLVGSDSGVDGRIPASLRSNGNGPPLQPPSPADSRLPFSKSGGSLGSSSLPAPSRRSFSNYANATLSSSSSKNYNHHRRHRDSYGMTFGPEDDDYGNARANSNTGSSSSKRGSTSTYSAKDVGDHASLGSRETDDTYPSSSTLTTNEGGEQHQAGGGMLTIWQPSGAIVSARDASRSRQRRSTLTRRNVVVGIDNNDDANALVLPTRTATSQRSLSRLPRRQQQHHQSRGSSSGSSSRQYHSQRCHRATSTIPPPRRERSSSSSSSLPRRTTRSSSEWELRNKEGNKSGVRSLSRRKNDHSNHHRRHRQTSNHRVRENDFSRSLPARRFLNDDDDSTTPEHGHEDDEDDDNRLREREFSRSLPARRFSDSSTDEDDTTDEEDDDDDSSCSTTASNRRQPQPQPQQLISLTIDDTGKGKFHIATRSTTKPSSPATKSPKSSSSSSSSSSSPHHLTFHAQLNEPSQQYLIHASIGRLDKIRELHPGVNILRTLSTWNEMQKQRRQYCNANGDLEDDEEDGAEVKGGQLVISPEKVKTMTSIGGGRTKTTDMVVMTLMGTYKCREWEHDSHFQRELERFVEDALQFQLCLNNKNSSVDGHGSGEACDGTAHAHHENNSGGRQAKGGGGAVEREEGGGGGRSAAAGRRGASTSGRRSGGVSAAAGLSKSKRSS